MNTPIYPYSSNSRYAFDNWSDGTTTTTDNIVLPAASTTFTANLTPQYYVTDYVNESCAGTINVARSRLRETVSIPRVTPLPSAKFPTPAGSLPDGNTI